MLKIKNIDSGYGKKQVLHAVSLEVTAGEIIALIGPNGSGKSTVLKVICGLLPVWNRDGNIIFNDASTRGRSPSKNIRSGITFSPQGNRVFNHMTVRENLEIGGFHLSKKQIQKRIGEVLSFFPALRHQMKRSAGLLSGGEQQMVAFARVLIPRPKLLLLDEPSLGLSPTLMHNVFKKITEINQQTGVSVLIVEQRVRDVLQIAQMVYALKLGKINWHGTSAVLSENEELMKNIFL